MRSKLREGELRVGRFAVTDEMERVIGEVDHPAAVRPFDPRLLHVPLGRNRPIQHLGSGRDLADFEGNPKSQRFQRLPYTISRDTSANRKELAGQAVEILAHPVGPAIGAHYRTHTSGIGSTKRPPHSRIPSCWSTISSLRFQGRIRT